MEDSGNKKFWAQDSDSDSEEQSDSSNDEVEQQRAGKAKASRWEIESSDESEEETRVVKSAKDKHFDGLRSVLRTIKTKTRNNDWVTIQDEFAKLQTLHKKADVIIKTNGVPLFYIKALVELEDAVKDTLAASKKKDVKLSKTNAKALTRMKHSFKKAEEITRYVKEMADCRANPSKYDEDEGVGGGGKDDDDSDSESSDSADSSDSDSDSSNSDDSDDSDDDDDDDEG